MSFIWSLMLGLIKDVNGSWLLTPIINGWDLVMSSHPVNSLGLVLVTNFRCFPGYIPRYSLNSVYRAIRISVAIARTGMIWRFWNIWFSFFLVFTILLIPRSLYFKIFNLCWTKTSQYKQGSVEFSFCWSYYGLICPSLYNVTLFALRKHTLTVNNNMSH
jgi:hypothetical protein